MKQECIVVRTKADMHIGNCKRNKRHATVEAAREDYLGQVRKDTEAVRARTSKAKTLQVDFADFVVSEMSVRRLVAGDAPSEDPLEQVIDEERFLCQLGL